MKILLINNFYYNRGGDCTYLFSLERKLIEHGHKVIIFAMHHPLNFDTEYSKYFVSHINYDEEIKTKSIASGLKVARRTIYSREAKRNLEKLIEAEKPDIAHIQNIHHHITPSIFAVLKSKNIPIIWTLHDYTLICPNTSFLCRGKICERCKKRKYFWPPLVRCKKDSFAASTMAAIEISMHLILGFYNYIDFFVAPSKFLHDKLIEYGIDKQKIVELNNFTCFTNVSNEQKAHKPYFVYLGRLSEEKGIKTLIDATIQAMNDAGVNGQSDKNYQLKIVGDGPLKSDMELYVQSMGAGNLIKFLGHRSHDEAMEVLKNSEFLVIPSEWYENFPYSILESFTLGKPVIASRVGGIPEIVKNWETGLLFEKGNPDVLAAKIGFFMRHPEKARSIGENARLFMSGDINSEHHYNKLMEVYKRALRMNGLTV